MQMSFVLVGLTHFCSSPTHTSNPPPPHIVLLILVQASGGWGGGCIYSLITSYMQCSMYCSLLHDLLYITVHTLGTGSTRYFYLGKHLSYSGLKTYGAIRLQKIQKYRANLSYFSSVKYGGKDHQKYYNANFIIFCAICLWSSLQKYHTNLVVLALCIYLCP